ncbi:MAG: DUF4124 domain-containing protein [Burkholderiaceae bacterium]
MKPRSSRAAKTLSLTGLVTVLCVVCLPAQAQGIYRCVTEAGVVEYSNTEPAAGKASRCKKLDLPAITTIPAPSLPAPKPVSQSAGKAGFPSVSASTQRVRDEDRLRILQKEYKREQEKLDELRAEYKDGQPDRLGNERNYQKYLDRVERLKGEIASAEGNVSALKAEIGALSD